jgi:crossover junction endodeoxyribonuclease RuvC
MIPTSRSEIAPMKYIGIDPGLSGGLACLEDGGVFAVEKMPPTNRDLLDLLRSWNDGLVNAVATIEFVRSSPQMGVTSSFTFGRGFGHLEMALTAAEIPYDEVTPLKWQQYLGCRSRGDKNVTKARAQELFPQVKVTHAIADALLIAEYGRRQWRRQ